MTARREAPRLSAGEMEMLQVLWREGPVTLAEAQHALGRPLGYTTVQTRLNRLVEKGLVARGRRRPARYEAAIAPEEVTAGHLELLLERVSGGNIVPLVAHLIQDRALSHEEIQELRALVNDAARRTQATHRNEEKP